MSHVEKIDDELRGNGGSVKVRNLNKTLKLLLFIDPAQEAKMLLKFRRARLQLDHV